MKCRIASSVSVFALGLSLPALAQERSDPIEEKLVDEIVVTAERRAASVQDVPVAITALSGDQLAIRQVLNTEDLTTFTPGLQFYARTGQGYITLRGVGGETNTSTTADPSVAFHIDGVYQTRNQGSLGTFFDIARIEVLRGPQGTLYGRNATGGSINVISNLPEFGRFGGNIQAAYGNYDTSEIKGYLNIPLGEAVAFRFSGIRSRNDGYTENLFLPGPEDDLSNGTSFYLRGQLAFDNLGPFTAVLRGTYGRRQGNSPAQEYLGPYRSANYTLPVGAIRIPAPPPAPPGTLTPFSLSYGAAPNPVQPRVTIQNERGALNDKSRGLNLTAAYDFGAVKLNFIAAGQWEDNLITSDVDATGAPAAVNTLIYDTRQLSGEVTLASNDEGRWDWIVGLFFLDEENEALSNFRASALDTSLPGNPPIVIGGSRTRPVATVRSYAAFGQVTHRVTDRFRLTGGLRYTRDRKTNDLDLDQIGRGGIVVSSLPPADPDVRNWSALTGRLALEYDLADENLLYASISRGYKAGGFGAGLRGPASSYNPEFIWAYEIGLKNRFFDDKLTLNLAAFYYDHRDLQVALFGAGIFGQPQLNIENAASASTKGLEAEFQFRPSRWISFDGSVALLDARYDSYTSADPFNPAAGRVVLDGRRKTFSPEATITVGTELRGKALGGDIVGRADVRYSSDVVLRQFAVRPDDIQNSYATVNGTVRYEAPDQAWFVEAFVRNLTDQNIKTSSFAVAAQATQLAADITATFAPPRTYGVRAGFNF